MQGIQHKCNRAMWICHTCLSFNNISDKGLYSLFVIIPERNKRNIIHLCEDSSYFPAASLPATTELPVKKKTVLK